MQQEKPYRWGHFLTIPSPYVAEMAANSFFDIITIDIQHSEIDIRTAISMIRAIQGVGKKAYVRLSGLDENEIAKFLDAGVDGLICPMLDTLEEVQSFLQASLYPPKGRRSFGPHRASIHLDYSQLKNTHLQQKRFVMLETLGAAAAIEEILKLDDLDGVLIGPYDMSLNMGLEKIADLEHPTLNALIRKSSSLAHANKKEIAIFLGSIEQLKSLQEIPFDWITLGTDASVLRESYHQIRSKMES